MNNLLQKAAGQGDVPQEDDGAEPNLNDPAYLKAKELALSKLYEEGASEGIAKALKVAPDLVTGLVEQGLVLFGSVDEATDGTVPDEMLMYLGIEMLGEVAEIASAAGLPTDGRTIAVAVQKFIIAVVEDLGGDTSQVQQVMSQIDPAQLGGAVDQAQARG